MEGILKEEMTQAAAMSPKFAAEMTDVYDKVFTEKEVNAIYAYQMSPVGGGVMRLLMIFFVAVVSVVARPGRLWEVKARRHGFFSRNLSIPCASLCINRTFLKIPGPCCAWARVWGSASM